MRRLPLTLVLLTFFALPQQAHAWATGHAAAAATRGALRALLDGGQIDQPTYDARTQDYADALTSITKLTGARRANLRGAVAEVDRVAAAGGLTAPRLTLAFETIRRNRQWWTTGPLLPAGRRISFPGSRLVWQQYSGSGLQVQWLGTFGKANALWQSGDRDEDLGLLLREALTYAVPRAGGIGFESWFSFDGGRPGWVSGLSAGTAAQAYARAAIRLQDPTLFDVGRQVLGVFTAPPPDGVRVDVAPGQAHYLLYSFAPKLRVLNAFTQALNGLRDFAALANDAPARELFAQGEARLRTELPTYDTGAWSMYSNRRESDLSYHRLARDFLRGLCDRLTSDGAPDPAVYCDAAVRFTGYLHTRPRIAFEEDTEPAAPRPKEKVAVPFALDKISDVTTTVTRDGGPIAGRTARQARGRHSVVFTPAKPGTYRVVVRATDLAGNSGATATRVRVASPPR